MTTSMMNTYAIGLNKADIKLRPIEVRGREIISKAKIEEIYYSFNENYKLVNNLQQPRNV